MNRKERIIEILKRNSNYPWGYQSLGEDDFDNVADEICAEPEEEIKRLKEDFLTLVFEPESNEACKIRSAAWRSAPLGFLLNRRDPTQPTKR